MKLVPSNWSIAKIGNVAEKIQYGYTASSTREGDIRLLRITDIQNDKVDWDKVPFCGITVVDYEKYALKDNDIVFARTGATVGKSFLIENVKYKSVFASYLIRFTLKAGVLPRYVKYFFNSRSYWDQITGGQAGIGQPNFNSSKLFEITFPLAPLPEQKRIVAKLDSLFAHLDQLRARLEKIPVLLKQFRQAVLTQAVTGKLTEEWRRGKNEEKSLNWDKGDFALPETWKWSKMNELAKLINGDRGTNYPNVNEYVEAGVPWINTGHIEPNGTLSLDRMNFITPQKFDSLGSGKVQLGDLVYCLRGATLGKTAIVEYEEGAIASSLVIIRPTKIIQTRYLYYFMVSPYGQELIGRFDNGTAQPNLAAKSVSQYPLPVPPVREQGEIVRRVESFFAIADRIEAHYQTLREKIDQLPQAILSKAFRGELVAQEVVKEIKSYATQLDDLSLAAEP